jgi:hypothetical protein
LKVSGQKNEKKNQDKQWVLGTKIIKRRYILDTELEKTKVDIGDWTMDYHRTMDRE